MIEKLHTLPFSSVVFFQIAFFCILFVWISKLFLKKIIPYQFAILIPTIAYLIFFFPKPIQILGLFLFLFFSVKLLFRHYHSNNLIFPILLLSSPMIAMKFLNANLLNNTHTIFESLRIIFQIAGLSYIVFKTIGLYVDLRGKKENLHIVDFANFILFTPTILIGPLDRIGRFKNDIKKGYENLNKETLYLAWDRLVKGILYKFILASFIFQIILSNLHDDGSFRYHILNMFSYFLYLYFDFAGYSYLAVSMSNFMGIATPINFNQPFISKNPKELWKRWHITLGSWLNDYFFKPLLKYFTQKKWKTSIQRQNIALFLTFTLMGFWNGFELHYILSGMLFGVYSVVHNYYSYRCRKEKKDLVFGKINQKIISAISIATMFTLTVFAIYIFSGHLI